jgi:hypothetical protein
MKRGEARLCKRAVDVRSGRLASSLAATQQNVEIVRDCGGRRRRVVQDPRPVHVGMDWEERGDLGDTEDWQHPSPPERLACCILRDRVLPADGNDEGIRPGD